MEIGVVVVAVAREGQRCEARLVTDYSQVLIQLRIPVMLGAARAASTLTPEIPQTAMVARRTMRISTLESASQGRSDTSTSSRLRTSQPTIEESQG